ncbi:MAG: hypothetical protein Q4P24_12350 [Rhodobacterales bacterium]|nr:hypothetical protein [Rhodobacterales bacterium]
MQQTASKIFGHAGRFGVGFTLKRSSDYAFDYVLYPVVILSLGYVWGGVVMTLLSVVMNILIIKAYDWAKQDLLMIEILKSTIHQDKEGMRFLSLRKFARNNDIAAFFFLSWIEDPIVVTLYLRKGSYQYNGMSFRDWNIFLGSTVVSNLFWIVSLGSVIELLKVFF